MPGHDRIDGFWLKKFASVHSRLALEMNRCLQGAHVPEKITFIQKKRSKETVSNNYRPIACSQMMRK